VNQNSANIFKFNFPGLRYWLTAFAVIWLLGAIGLGWLVKSFFILVGVIVLAPVIAFIGFRWWLKRNLVEDQCPVCSYEFVGFDRTQFQCPSCGENLKIDKGHFERLTPPGTIDVEAVEVQVSRLED
jgi:hypothetical protein